MTRVAAVFAAAFALSGTAWAQTAEIPSQPIRIVITKLDCSRLVRHTPSADVAYQSGVDARGRRVAPADVPGSGADAIPGLVPDVLEFPITINPVAYGARNQAQREKAAALQGQADTHAGKTAAQARITALTQERTTLNAQATALAGQKAALDAEKATLATNLATLQAEVDAGTRAPSDRDYVRAKAAVPAKEKQVVAKQGEIDAKAAEITANTSATAAQQAIVDAAPGRQAQHDADQAAAEAKLAAISAKGLDDTTMAVGTVRYDMAKGTFTFNGQPLGSPEQEELARACAKRGVR
ncbi:MAG: hypothetical protein NVV74_20360 [Magnetospirillum sp.]|nr:hypothetical protein [Magnetospirillum sp.]